MVFRILSKSAIFFTLTFLMGMYNGCTSAVSFEASPSTTSVSSVCSPFSSGNSGNSSGVSSLNGLQATITYIPPTSPLVTNRGATLTTASFQPGMPDVVALSTPVYLDQLDVETQDFSLGFQAGDGSYLKDLSGNKLVQYFALHMPGSIMLNPGDTSDLYQFALLSDDGSVMEIADNNGVYKPFINNDRTHSNTLSCSASTVQMTVGKPINMKLDYFQGPPQRIALVLVWRHGSSVNMKDPHCGANEGDGYYFTNDSSGKPQPTANWTNLLKSGGWQVVPAANFYLPSGVTNPCN